MLLVGIVLTGQPGQPALAFCQTAEVQNNPAQSGGDQTLLLEVRINGHPIDRVGEFVLHDGVLLVEQSELHSLGIRGPLKLVARPSPQPGANDLVNLNDLSGLSWRLDEATQILYLSALDTRLVPTLIEADESPESIDRRSVQSGNGVTLNYDVSDGWTHGRNGANGAFDLRAFSSIGVLSSGALAFSGNSSGSPGKDRVVRLDSTFSYADVGAMRRYSAGDFITGALGWTRPVRMGGLQLRSDFSTRPDLITFPLPSVSGSVAVPSTVDVLANGNSVLVRQIDPGPFQISQLPVVSGANTITMTVSNALGQQTTLTQAFYASSALLAPGLQTYSVQAGAVRREWGSVSNDYRSIAGVADYRRGLSRFVTVEGSAEGTPGAEMAGVGGVFRVANLGMVNISSAASAGASQIGKRYSAGAQRMSRVFSLGLSIMIADRYFRDVAAVQGAPVERKQVSASTGVSTHRHGSIGIAYAALDQGATPGAASVSLSPPQHAHILTASYSRQFGRTSFYANDFQELDGKQGGGFQVGLTVPFGRRASANLNAGSSGSGAQVQQSASEVGQWGYQAYASAGGTEHAFAQIQHKARWNLLTAGVDSGAGGNSARVESQGALSFVDGSLFPSNTIYDSFAVVDTSGLANVSVLQEDRFVGRSDHTGRLLVPDMRAFDVNHLAIDANDVPQDATLQTTEQVVRPQDRSGVVVNFTSKISHGALLVLVDVSGDAIPVGSTARLEATGETMPVGYDGDVYLENLGFLNRLEVKKMDGTRCSVVFAYRPIAGEIPRLGPLVCVSNEP